MTLPDRIARAIEISGLPQVHVARLAGISGEALRLILRGQSEPKLSTLRALATACCVSYEWLAVGAGNPSDAQVRQ